MKKVIFFAVLIAAVTITWFYPETMISPGELAEVHQHISNKCTACHQPFGGISNNKCMACHSLSEIGKASSAPTQPDSVINRNKVLFHQNLANQNCIACHTDHKGIQPAMALSKFEHSLLTKGVVNKCISCHEAPINELHKQLSTDCKSCHNTDAWTWAVRFDHDMIITVDKSQCVACHQSPKDTFHNMSGTSCMECHNINKWVPSDFDHTSFFVFDKHHTTNCTTCHANSNFETYTCYGCHEHSESNIRGEHLEEGIQNFQDCVSCHKSGNEHDIRMNNAFHKSGDKTTKKDRDHDEHDDHDQDDD